MVHGCVNFKRAHATFYREEQEMGLGSERRRVNLTFLQRTNDAIRYGTRDAYSIVHRSQISRAASELSEERVGLLFFVSFLRCSERTELSEFLWRAVCLSLSLLSIVSCYATLVPPKTSTATIKGELGG